MENEKSLFEKVADYEKSDKRTIASRKERAALVYSLDRADAETKKLKALETLLASPEAMEALRLFDPLAGRGFASLKETKNKLGVSWSDFWDAARSACPENSKITIFGKR